MPCLFSFNFSWHDCPLYVYIYNYRHTDAVIRNYCAITSGGMSYCYRTGPTFAGSICGSGYETSVVLKLARKLFMEFAIVLIALQGRLKEKCD